MGAAIVGISFDTAEENAAFAQEHGFAYSLLADVTKEVGEAYEVKRPPEHDYAAVPRRFSYLISPEGKIARAYKVDDVASHAQQVLADLEELATSSEH